MPDQDKLDQSVAKAAEDGQFTKEEMKALNEQAKKLKGVNLNLAYARQAVAFMNLKMKLVANWDQKLDTSAEAIGDKILQQTHDRVRARAVSERAWDKADQCVYGQLRQTPDWLRIDAQGGVQSLDDIQTLARLVDANGCGNCGEMAARTFIYLFNLNIRPLDYYALNPDADHAFVVIGRVGGDDNDWRTWGKTAVVCDPWASGLLIPMPPGYVGTITKLGDNYAAYPADLLGAKMKTMFPTTFREPLLVYREE
ncbi:MAG TPA: hypothetical protein VH682_28420 [Gemmataceae bacterium]|jgi:hypothetical protein